MGSCNSLPQVGRNIILCDKKGNIVNVTKCLLKTLDYNFETLEGQFIGILMSDFMSMLHKKYFINTYNASKGVEKNLLDNKLRALHHKRSLIIYDINKKSHIVNIGIQYNIPIYSTDFYKPGKNSSELFYINIEFLVEPIHLFHTNNLIEKDGAFKINKTNTVIISTDFIKSTEMLHDRGISTLLDTSIRFHKVIDTLIRTKYYPFVYLHEVIGDCFVLTLNTDWTYNIDKFCASLAVNFIFDLIHSTKDFIKIRTGIGYGTIHYGTIGSIFRFFGFPMNIAARLENKCNENEINVCSMFYFKLIEEMSILGGNNHKVAKKSDDLKGFGLTDYYTIAVSDSTPFIEYI